MRVKKIMQIHTTMKNLDEIKERIRQMHGHEVVWEKNQNDGRKHQQTCRGVIGNTYPSHFSVKTDYGYTSFNYVDLLTENVILRSSENGVNILELR